MVHECCWARAQHYMEHDTKLRKFVPLIQRALVYPLVMDARRTVLSLPPIINGAHSAVRLCSTILARFKHGGCSAVLPSMRTAVCTPTRACCF